MTEAVAVAVADEPLQPVEEAPETFEFDQFPIVEELREALRTMGYHKPTQVQSQVLKVAMNGDAPRDLIVQSKTGSGKTSAFGIPLIQMIDSGSAAPGAPSLGADADA
ncbi:MAG: DEAD/DEAH box helicase [Myxococcota bacterium]